MADYIQINKANWDERAPEHATAPGKTYRRLLSDPTFLSDVVRFDVPLLGDISDVDVMHLQCHIATDTISLARLGCKRVVGLDFSPASIREGRRLAANAAGGERLSFVEAPVYDALRFVEPGSFDLVFTGIGALCWLPDIKRWAQTVAALLRPGGRLFLREAHPVLWSLDEKITTDLCIRHPYFERKDPMESEGDSTCVELRDDGKAISATKAIEWNHGLGEIVQSLMDAGMQITGLVEHQSLPWEALPEQMTPVANGEFALTEHRDRLPLSYTLQALKKWRHASPQLRSSPWAAMSDDARPGA